MLYKETEITSKQTNKQAHILFTPFISNIMLGFEGTLL